MLVIIQVGYISNYNIQILIKSCSLIIYLYSLHIDGDAHNDVQNLCSTADFFLLKWRKRER